MDIFVDDDTQPTLTVDLGSITEFEDPQYFTVDSSRIEFFMGGRRGFGPRIAAPSAVSGSAAFRYTIEASRDGKSFETILDKTDSDFSSRSATVRTARRVSVPVDEGSQPTGGVGRVEPLSGCRYRFMR